MNKNATLLVTSLVLLFQGSIAKAEIGDRVEAYEISKQAYIYAFPMIAGYKAMNEFNIDKTNSQYKGPFNTIISAANVFTPKDTAIVTPNSDTPRCCRWIYGRSRLCSAFRLTTRIATTRFSLPTCI